MSPLLLALIQLGIELEPSVAHLLVTGFEAAARALAQTNQPPDLGALALKIVRDLDSTAFSPEFRASEARAAITLLYRNAGELPPQRIVNLLTELAVQAKDV